METERSRRDRAARWQAWDRECQQRLLGVDDLAERGAAYVRCISAKDLSRAPWEPGSLRPPTALLTGGVATLVGEHAIGIDLDQYAAIEWIGRRVEIRVMPAEGEDDGLG